MYSHVFVGGTFDGIHNGHESLLAHAFAVGDMVTVGVTSDAFIKMFKSHPDRVTSFEKRKKALEDWTQKNDFQNRAHIIAIEDPHEPAASMDHLDAIIVTRDNRTRGEEINQRRKQKHLPELILVEVPIVPAEDADPISTTRIKNGEIDVAGKLLMPDAMRPELAKPLGAVLVGDAIGTSIEKYREGTVVTVGDITTKTLLTAGVVPNLAIVDFQVGRKPFPELDAKLKDFNMYRIEVKSGPGFIAHDAIARIEKWSAHPTEKIVMVVTGEEDLLALPAVVHAPVGSVVYYGQPPVASEETAISGMVEVVVTEEKKKVAAELLSRFT